jgi:hypothetical protein
MNKYIILSLVAFISAQSPQLKQVVISSGAIQSDQVKGTVGQPIVGRSETNNTVLSAGFWGSIAQNVQKVLPEAVSIIDPENGYLGVSYTSVTPLLIEAVKEQQTQIEYLQNQYAHLMMQNQKLMELVSTQDIKNNDSKIQLINSDKKNIATF